MFCQPKGLIIFRNRHLRSHESIVGVFISSTWRTRTHMRIHRTVITIGGTQTYTQSQCKYLLMMTFTSRRPQQALAHAGSIIWAITTTLVRVLNCQLTSFQCCFGTNTHWLRILHARSLWCVCERLCPPTPQALDVVSRLTKTLKRYKQNTHMKHKPYKPMCKKITQHSTSPVYTISRKGGLAHIKGKGEWKEMRGNETEWELQMSGKLREFERGRKTKYDRTNKLKRQKGISQQSLSPLHISMPPSVPM